MRLRNLSLVAVAVAAGLSLTACQSGGDDSSASAKGKSGDSSSSSSSSSSQGSDGGSSGGSSGGGSAGGDEAGTSSKSAGARSATCKTSQLAIRSAHGMGEGDILVHLKNTGSATCTLKGFPGVDLKGKDGTVSASRSKLSAPTVRVKPGDETRFTLHYPPNDSGGSGATFTSMVVTPPNETHSKTLSTDINIPVSDGSGPGVRVDPVGTGK